MKRYNKLVEQVATQLLRKLLKKYGRRTENTLLLVDAYKCTHWKQYPKNTRTIFSYLESRGGQFSKTLFYGLQMILKKYFEGEVVQEWMIDEAQEVLGDVFFTDEYFNRAGWERILKVHGGRLPLKIKAVREGTVIGTRQVLVTVENTDPELPWLTNWAETVLHQVWYTITVATLSYQIKEQIKVYADLSSDLGVSPYHLNDFGFRGVSSVESGGLGGSANLVTFKGTDTLQGIVYAMRYYGAKKDVGHSVAATEHSTITIYTREKEFDAYRYFVEQYQEGILSVVSDSYNIWDAIRFFGTELKEAILARGSKTGFAKFVVRPDSGDPVAVSVKVIQDLDKYFGSTINSKGYKVLNPKVGVIYGDGINYDSIGDILKAVTDAGYSTDCIVFGMGGGLLQAVDRDVQKFAFKCSAAEMLIGDALEWVDVYKDPVDDKGKGSKRGRLDLIKCSCGDYETIQGNAYSLSQLHTVFENGVMIKEWTWDEVIAKAAE